MFTAAASRDGATPSLVVMLVVAAAASEGVEEDEADVRFVALSSLRAVETTTAASSEEDLKPLLSLELLLEPLYSSSFSFSRRCTSSRLAPSLSLLS